MKRIIISILLVICCLAYSCQQEVGHLPQVVAEANEYMYVQIFEPGDEKVKVYFEDPVDVNDFEVIGLMLNENLLDCQLSLDSVESSDSFLVISIENFVQEFNQISLKYKNEDIIINLPYYSYSPLTMDIVLEDESTSPSLVSGKNNVIDQESISNFLIDSNDTIEPYLMIGKHEAVVASDMDITNLEDNNIEINYGIIVDSKNLDGNIKEVIVEVLVMYEKANNQCLLFKEVLPIEINE